MPDIFINSFVRRQTEFSPFSHWIISDNELIQRIQDNFDNQSKGYRDGVILVQIPPEGFFSSIIQLKENDKLIGCFTPRQTGEFPRKSTYVIGNKSPAKRVDVVLYHHNVLIEKQENESDKEWEIVCVNACPTDEPSPIPPDTLIANHFELSGGTKTNMSDSEFVNALRESVNYWKDKSLVGSEI